MGAMQRANEAKLEQKLQSRTKSRYSQGDAGDDVLEWSVADAADGLVAETIHSVLAVGDLISFSKARTGCAVNITILSGDERFKFWSGNVNEFELNLHNIQRMAAGGPAPTRKE